MSQASEVFAAGFEFFYPNGSDQVGYLATLLDRKTDKRRRERRTGRELWLSAFKKLGASPALLSCFQNSDTTARTDDIDGDAVKSAVQTSAEDNLLALLLSRFASFGAGSRLMDEMEGKGVVNKKQSYTSVKRVFRNLLRVCAQEAYNMLDDLDLKLVKQNRPDLVNLREDKFSGALVILQNLQKQLLGRAGLFIRLSAKEREAQQIGGGGGAGGAGRDKLKPYQLALQTLVVYAEDVLRESTQVLRKTISIVEEAFTCDVLGTVGTALLEFSFVGKLARPLLTALTMLAVPEHQALALRLLPEMTALTLAMDQMSELIQKMPGSNSLMPIMKVVTFESQHPYRAGLDPEDTSQNKRGETAQNRI